MEVEGRGAARPLAEPLGFEEFFLAEQHRLFSALCMITGNSHDAEEIGQEAFARVWERWNRVGSMVDPAGYLFRVAMNVFRSRYRRALVAARRLSASREEHDPLAEVDESDVVDRMLALLTPRQRAAVVLVAMLEYSSDEAGAMLGMRGSTVRVLVMRARTTLRAQQAGQ
jgi:RNA polymerase sigma-70 factor (ECF subfamily)